MEENDTITADAGVLGMLLVAGGTGRGEDARLMELVEDAGVTPEWFRNMRQRLMFEAVKDAWAKNQTLDALAVRERYEALAKERGEKGNNAAAFTMLFSELVEAAPAAGHFEHYLGRLRKRHVYGTVHRICSEFMAESSPESIDFEVEELAKKLIDVSDELAKSDGQSVRSLGSYMAESVEKKRRLHEERFVKHNWEYMDGLPWPWHAMNNIFAGLKTGLHVIGALTSDGKSTMAADISVFWNQRGIKHAYFSIDMAAEGMTDRYPCIAKRVSLAKLNFGGSAEDVAKFAAGYEEQAKLDNVSFSEEDDIGKIAVHVARGIRAQGWRAIIIDYIQLLTAEEKGQMPEYTRVQRVVQSAKRIAKKHKIPVICLAQLSRAFEKELREKAQSPGTDAIGDSAEIARAAASITVLYRDADMAKYWRETPPTQLAYGDRHDRAIECGVTTFAEEAAEDREKGQSEGTTTAERRKGQTALAKALRPMWVDVIKNQQGGRAKVPFVMYPNYFLFRPGNQEGEDIDVTVEGKQKKLPVGKFEQLCDDWTYTAEDWWLEMTNAMPQRGCRLLGETYREMRERFAREREKHRDVRHFVREYDARGNVEGWHWEEARQ